VRRLFRRFLELPRPRQVLLAESVCLLAFIRTALRVLPFRFLWTAVQVGGRRFEGTPVIDAGGATDVLWAVDAAARRLPWIGTCLCQALAAQLLLARRGVSAEVHIGVAREPGGGLTAHAWLESDRRLLLGGPVSRLGRYSSLSVLRREA